MPKKPKGRKSPKDLSAVRRTIHEKLVASFEEAGGTQEDMATAVGVSRSAVYKWLSGESCVDIDHIKPVCDYLGIPVNALLGEEPSRAELSRADRELFARLAKLDVKGRAKVEDYVDDLLATGMYDSAGS